MNLYPENQIVEVVLPYQNTAGATIVPTEITAKVFDGEEELLLDFGTIAFNPLETETKVIVPGLTNTLQDENLKEVRRVEFQVTHTAGVFAISKSYAIEAFISLQVMRNSFMTFETAEMMSLSFVNLTAFQVGTAERRKASLQEAYQRITDLPMIFKVTSTETLLLDDDLRVEGETYRIDRNAWRLVTPEIFRTVFPKDFQTRLRMAQLAEADDLLQGNVIARKHAQGIASETVGESSVSLRAGSNAGITSVIGTQALSFLSGYIDRTMKIGRA